MRAEFCREIEGKKERKEGEKKKYNRFVTFSFIDINSTDCVLCPLSN